MKYIKILEQPSAEAIELFAEKRNLSKYLGKEYHHPQEDFLMSSKNHSIFVVADGVTLNFKKLIEDSKKYPNPSPAGDVSRIFCESVVEYANKIYENFNEDKIKEVFKYANKEVFKFNDNIGKTDISGNKTGYYSATGAFVVLKDGSAYWASIYDSYVAQYDKEMNLKFISSKPNDYIVINGEEIMNEQIETGVLKTEEGDRIFVFTDGFEDYVKLPGFLEIFKDWDEVEDRITELSKEYNLKDPEKYGHERSLIAILV